MADAVRADFVREMKGLTKLVKSLKIPCFVIGIGVRAPYEPEVDFSYSFDDVVREFLKAVLEKSAIIGVRGWITADYLSRLGFKEERDFTIIGCPSMYTFGGNGIKIRESVINSDSVVYLLDSNDYVARTFIPGGKGEIQEQAKYLLESLIIDGPKNNSIPNGFRQLIPAGTEIKDLSLENNVLTINFSKELLDINEKYEEKMLESIVYTLTNIEGIDSVVIKVEGEVLKELPNSKKQLPTSLDRSYGINKYYDISSVNNVDSYTVYYVSSYNNNGLFR